MTEETLTENDNVEFIFFMGCGTFDFTEEEIERYSRHIILKDVGGEDNRR